MKEKEDLRVVKTRKFLTIALFELLEEMPFEKVSVVDICERSMVHRATFYAHFEDKYHLLNYVIEDIKESLFKQTIRLSKLDSVREAYLGLLKATLSYIDKNKKMLKAIFNNNRDEFILGITLQATKKSIHEFLENFEIKNNLNIPLDVFLDFFSGGIANLALNYIKSSNPYSIKELVKYLDKMINENIYTSTKLQF